MAKWLLAWQCSTPWKTIVMCKFYYDFLAFTAVQGVFEVSPRNKNGKGIISFSAISACREKLCGSNPRKVQLSLHKQRYHAEAVHKKVHFLTISSQGETTCRSSKKVHFLASTPWGWGRRYHPSMKTPNGIDSIVCISVSSRLTGVYLGGLQPHPCLPTPQKSHYGQLHPTTYITIA